MKKKSFIKQVKKLCEFFCFFIIFIIFSTVFFSKSLWLLKKKYTVTSLLFTFHSISKRASYSDKAYILFLKSFDTVNKKVNSYQYQTAGRKMKYIELCDIVFILIIANLEKIKYQAFIKLERAIVKYGVKCLIL